MATNPMQRKARNSFILGVLIATIVAALIIGLMYMKITSLKKENEKYISTTKDVFVLNQDVKSGQVLDASMFISAKVPITAIPTEAEVISITGMNEILVQRSFKDTNGNNIYYSNAENKYVVKVNGKDKPVYMMDSEGQPTPVTYLTAEDNKYFFYLGEGQDGKTMLSVTTNAVVATIDLPRNTVMTTSMITRSEEMTTNDLREQEYNIIALPVELMTGDYVDIRLSLPTGEDYIVAAKKRVSIPMANGTYLPDTIKVNMTEQDIVVTSCAIVDNYQIEGSKLYATKYTAAGLQKEATVTYVPSNDVFNLINKDPNIVKKATIGILENRNRINSAIVAEDNRDRIHDNIKSKTEGSITSALDQRKQYLQSLTAAQ